jgi:Protein of unknown function (DUF3027)
MSVASEDLVESVARAAVIETADDESAVGGLRGVVENGEGLVSVRYECLLSGYVGWEWTVDVAVVDGAATVCESALLPGENALLAPEWVPWSDRVRPGDLEPGMVLPYVADDERLVPGYNATGDEDLDLMAIYEFGLGRERVLAPEAREAVADRWYRGSHGPSATSAAASAEPCSTCAFWVPIAGSFRVLFGVCANEWSPSDGRVVSVDHGCGAHSQTEAERRLSEWPGVEPVVDSGAVDPLDLVTEPQPEGDTQPGAVDVDVEAIEAVVTDEYTLATNGDVEFAEVAIGEVESFGQEPAVGESPKDEDAAE